MSSSTPYYLKGSPLNVRLNSVIGWLARHGISLAGTAELSVKGRKSGAMQRVPVNPHTHEGGQYLVSARGHSQWVRNMRAAHGGELRVGRKVRTFTAVGRPAAEKLPLRRADVGKWGGEGNQYLARGAAAAPTDAEILACAGDHPVFRTTVPK